MFARVHACPQFTLLPIWFSTSHGELTASSDSEEDLRIMHEATGPLLTFRTGKDSELRAGKLCSARASEELSVPRENAKTV